MKSKANGESRIKRMDIRWSVLLAILFMLSLGQPAKGDDLAVFESTEAGTNVYNVFLLTEEEIGTNGQPEGLPVVGDLLSINGNGQDIPFNTVGSGTSTEIYQFSISPPADSFEMTIELAWTNVSTNITIDFVPLFLQQPQSQSFVVGTNVVLATQPIHTSVCQWQKDGTNLIDDGHFNGSTNATLTISNAQPSDEGNYVLLVGNPLYPLAEEGYASLNATLSVFKTLKVGLSADNGSLHLLIANQDLSAIDDDESSNLIVYTTTDLTLDISQWDVFSVAGVITNGVYDIDILNDGSSGRYWVVGQPQ